MFPSDTIAEVKQSYWGECQTFSCRQLAQNPTKAIVLYSLPKNHVIPLSTSKELSLDRGDLSIGYFWVQRPYNVYNLLSSTGITKAFYVNISDCTTISPQQIYWRDLIVDLLFLPDGSSCLLDEGELPTDLSAQLTAHIAYACRQLVTSREKLIAQWQISTESQLNRYL